MVLFGGFGSAACATATEAAYCVRIFTQSSCALCTQMYCQKFLPIHIRMYKQTWINTFAYVLCGIFLEFATNLCVECLLPYRKSTIICVEGSAAKITTRAHHKKLDYERRLRPPQPPNSSPKMVYVIMCVLCVRCVLHACIGGRIVEG